MAVTVYTRDRIPLDDLREQQILSRIYTENAILEGGAVVAGSAFNVSRTPGWYVIKGVLIYDDATTIDWIDMAVEEPAYGGDRVYVFWVRFDPLTDDTPTFGVSTSPTDSVEIAAVFDDDTYLVLCIVSLADVATSAEDGVYRRYDLRMDQDAWRKVAMDGYLLSFSCVKYEEVSSSTEGNGVHRIRWEGMQLAGERLGWIYTIEGDEVSPAENGPHSSALEWELEFPNFAYGFLFVRAPREEPQDDIVTAQTAQLSFVGLRSSTGSLEDSLSVWGSTDSDYVYGEDVFPARPQREDVRLLGFVANGTIRWVNGSYTLIGGYSSPAHGDSHLVNRIFSSVYGTSSFPDDEGKVDLDDLITNIEQLSQMSLDAAYDGPTGSGSGRGLNLDSGSIRANVMHSGDELPGNPWMAGLELVQDEAEQGGESFESGITVFDQFSDQSAKWRHAIQQVRVWSFDGVAQRNKTATLSWDGSYITMVLTGGSAPVFSDFAELIPFPVFVTFGELGLAGQNAPLKVYRCLIDVGSSTVRIYTSDLVNTIPTTYPDDFGAMASDLDCEVTIWVAGLQLGGFTNYMGGRLTVGGNAALLAKLDVTGKLVALSDVDVVDELRAGEDASVWSIETDATGTKMNRDLTMDGAEIISDANISTSANVSGVGVLAGARGSFGYLVPFVITRTFTPTIVEKTGWTVDWPSYKFVKPDTGSNATLVLGLTAITGIEITGFRFRIVISNSLSPYALTIRLIRVREGTIGSLTTVAAIHSYILGTTSPVVGSILAPETLAWTLGSSVKVLDGDSFFLEFIADNITLSPWMHYLADVENLDH